MYKRIRKISAWMLATLIAISALAATQAMAASVIVQLDQAPAAHLIAAARQQGREVSVEELQAYRNDLRAGQDAFLEQLSSRGIDFRVLESTVFDYGGNTTPVANRYTLVLNGMALEVPDSAVAAIEAMPVVSKVYPNRTLRVLLDKSVDYIRAPEVYGDVAELSPFDDFREGFEGQGIIISVIDTGIEWSHEMFGGDASPPRLGLQPPLAAANNNEKVIYYMPLVGGAIDDFGHGSHVSADAAGFRGFAPGPDGVPLTADDVPIHGVAPQARLMGYKACNAAGSCVTNDIILGIEDSVSPRTLTGFPKPVATVINMSLGGAGGPDSATAVAADNAALTGTIVVASAGNSGPGEATVGSPAAGRHVIAVGANTDPGVPSPNVDVLDPGAVDQASTGAVVPAGDLPSAAGQRSGIRVFHWAGTPLPPDGGMAQHYVFVRNGETIDEWPPEVSGRIALVKVVNPRIGSHAFAQIANNGALAGAIAVLFMGETQNATAVAATIPSATILPPDGEFLVDLIASDDDDSQNPPNGAISEFPIRLNPSFPEFTGQMAGFSSRGPVQGFGQVKPDVTAPGVEILSATSPVGAPVASMQSATRYISASGTSFSGPQTAGSVALIKQAHPGWGPAEVRTALINTATNLRDGNGVPKPDGLEADNILAQGGGLVDVFEAVNAAALMGIPGDGIQAPAILGSHSFGTVPVINSRVSHTTHVDAILRDTSGDGGTYNLSIVNNRDLQLDGIDVGVRPSSITLDPGGSGNFSVDVTVDGDLIRATRVPKLGGIGNTISFTLEPIQMQWYVVAERDDGGETLRMPMYLKPTASIPASSLSQSETFSGTILAGDTNLQLVGGGGTFQDFPVMVGEETFRLQGDLEFDDVVDGTAPDLDLFLMDPDGAVVASSTNGGGPEHIDFRPGRTGTFTWRVTGFVSAATAFDLTSTRLLGGSPPQLFPIEGEFTDSQDRAVDFDGTFVLEWEPVGNPPIRYEVERSVDGGPFEVIATPDGSATSLVLSQQPEGELAFRLKALFPGEIGFFVSAPSESEGVIVDRRSQVDITDRVDTAVSNVSLADGVFQLDLNITNQAADAFLPLVEFNIIGIDSGSGTVAVINADNGGSGTSVDDPALFDYSHKLGSDDLFSAGETTGSRTIRFRDERSELFTFDALVTAFVDTGAAAGDSGSGGTTTSGSGTDSGSGGALIEVTSMLRFTVDPLTGSITVKLLDGLL